MATASASLTASISAVSCSWQNNAGIERRGAALNGGMTTRKCSVVSRTGRQMRHVVSVATTKELQTESKVEEEEKEVEEVEEEEDDEETLAMMPNTFEIQSLLMELCDETKIAEVQLKVGSFKLHVKRGLKSARASVNESVIAPPVPSKPMIDSLPAIPAAPVAPPATRPAPVEDDDVDEGLQYVTSPRVGIFRRGRGVRGKSGKPVVEEGSVVKKGQVVCYLEQLGTSLAIESAFAGEVEAIMHEDGDAVGYAEPLIGIRPSFPGIKMLT